MKRKAYGRYLRYPQGRLGEAVKALTGKRTVSEEDLECLEELGLEVCEVESLESGDLNCGN